METLLYRKISEAHQSHYRDRHHDPIDEVVESRFSADGSWSRPPEAAGRLLRTEAERVAALIEG